MDVLCTTDLTTTSAKAVTYADAIAATIGASVSLLHILEGDELKGDGRSKAEQLMDQHCALVKKTKVERLLREGNFIREIATESGQDHSLMVVATHGPRGLRQSLFGSDILKLIRKSHLPTIVVQEHSPAPGRFSPIVMPVAAHKEVDQLIDAVILLAGHYGSEVHIYQLSRPGEKASKELMENKWHMAERLKKAGITHQEVIEPSTTFSFGFAGPTIAYADKVGAGCIAIMAIASDEYRYIADAEKEKILTNEPGIPVLCAR